MLNPLEIKNMNLLKIFNFRIDRVEQLLEAGINVNSWDSEGSKNTPLHWAACYGNKEIIACLIGIDHYD